MKYRATLVATCYQIVEVEAPSKEEAARLMLNEFVGVDAECAQLHIDGGWRNIEEVKE